MAPGQLLLPGRSDSLYAAVSDPYYPLLSHFEYVPFFASPCPGSYMFVLSDIIRKTGST